MDEYIMECESCYIISTIQYYIDIDISLDKPVFCPFCGHKEDKYYDN